MTRWQLLEEWLEAEAELRHFTSRDVAAVFRISYAEASELIQSYLTAQRAKRSKTLFVLKRQGRTASAVWDIGVRSADVRRLNETLVGDVSVKLRKAWALDARRIGDRNPRARRYVEAKVEAAEHALAILAAALDYMPDDDE